MTRLPHLMLIVAACVAAVLGYFPGLWLAVCWLLAGSVIGTLPPSRGVPMLLALLPVAGFAAFTGSIWVEEFDLLALGALLVWRARLAPLPGVGSDRLMRVWMLCWLLALTRGLMPEGQWPAWQWPPPEHYASAWNALRIGKSLLLAGWLASMLDASMMPTVWRGNLAGLVLVSLICLWERAAFPGLGNFSADYRITGPFWEMHVGGAALDGYLMLTFPAVCWLLWQAHSRAALLAAAVVFALAGFVVVSTFSRALQLGFAVVLAVLAAGWMMQSQANGRHLLAAAVGLIAAAAMAAAVFDTGGYRALAAVMSVAMLCAWLGGGTPPLRAQRFLFGAVLLSAALGSALIHLAAPKGPYLAFAINAAGTIAAYRSAFSGVRWALALALAGNAVAVAVHWGGAAALPAALAANLLAVSLAACSAHRARPLWTISLRGAVVLASLLVVAALSAVLAHSAFMGARVDRVSRDFADRIAHWNSTLALWQAGDVSARLSGFGLGRFPARAGAHDSVIPGLPTHQFMHDDSVAFLRLLPMPRSQPGIDLLRVSQSRARWPREAVTLALSVRAEATTTLVVSLCYKHLLYAESCEHQRIAIRATGGRWQRVSRQVDLSRLNAGPWYAPRDAMLAVALPGANVDLTAISITDGSGAELIDNGNFEEGPVRWFFTSDHHHLPWHIKQLFLGVLFDCGVLGLALFILLLSTAALRAARAREGAFMLAAIAGFVVVGTFDTLIDAPRVALLFFLMLSLALRAQPALPSPVTPSSSRST